MRVCGAIVRTRYIDRHDGMEQTVPWPLGNNMFHNERAACED